MHFLFYLLKRIQRHILVCCRPTSETLLELWFAQTAVESCRTASYRLKSVVSWKITIACCSSQKSWCTFQSSTVFCMLAMLHSEPFLTIVTFKTVGYCLDCVQVTLNCKLQLLNTLLLLSSLLSTSIFDANYAISCWWKLWLWWHARYFKLACIKLFALLHRVCGIKGPATFGK